jgi:hypothetical protein
MASSWKPTRWVCWFVRLSSWRLLLGQESDYQGLGEATIVRQSPDPGTSVREGFEVRLYLKEE